MAIKKSPSLKRAETKLKNLQKEVPHQKQKNHC